MDNDINTIPKKECYLCGSQGSTLYKNLTDKLFGVSGKWHLNICTNSNCQLVWLDPMPKPDELIKIYANYYTHKQYDTNNNGFLSRLDYALYRRINLLLSKLSGMSKQRIKSKHLFLQDNKTKGSLLDIGCGNGHWLNYMHKLGWQVEGTDFDQAAVEEAKKEYGLTVRLGELADIAYPDHSFDAVTLRHVIEHHPDPVSLLAECLRILKPNGKLVVITPNTQSWGHKHYGRHWRGLEPPRHLHIFSPKTLKHAAEKAGFKKINAFSTAAGAEYILEDSQAIKQSKSTKFNLTSKSWILQYYELWKLRKHPELGEEAVLLAQV